MGANKTVSKLCEGAGAGGRAIDLLAEISNPQVQAKTYEVDTSGD